MARLHKDIVASNYISGVKTAISDVRGLLKDFEALYAGLPEGQRPVHGFVEVLDFNHVDVARHGRPIARIEVHHDRSDIDTYHHTDEEKFLDIARRHGYEHASL